MADMKGFRDIKCAVAGYNAQGEPDFYYVLVRARPAQIENGDHYDAARDVAIDDDFTAKVVFDEDDPAGRALVEHCVWDSIKVTDIDRNPNENCLQGMRCINPNCIRPYGPFKIVATSTFLVFDNGTEEHEDVEWEDDNWAMCVECETNATVGQLRRADAERACAAGS